MTDDADRVIFKGRVYVHDGTKRPDYRGVEVVPEAQLAGAVERASEMYEEFVAERRMLREALFEHGETDEMLAARYAALRGQ